jgi:hypothetical protein
MTPPPKIEGIAHKGALKNTEKIGQNNYKTTFG